MKPVKMLPNPKPSKGKSRYPRWVMKDGTKVRIEDMSNTHIINSINLMERKAREMYSEVEHSMWSVYGSLQGEMAIDSMENEINSLDKGGWENILPSVYYDLCKELERRGVSVEHKQY